MSSPSGLVRLLALRLGDALGRALRDSHRRATITSLSVAIAVVVVLFAPRAEAIPAFARRYETSCQTCHIAFPKLTPFGEAFRRNGYRFPGGGDATAEKEEPLPLGADAQKDVWPNGVVYPGQLPGRVPISLMVEGTASFGSKFEDHAEASHEAAAMAAPGATPDSHTKELKFGQLGGDARLLTGGTLGSVASFFGSIAYSDATGVEIERANLIFTPIDSTGLQIKVGKFEPSLHGVSIHRGLLGHQLRLTTTMVGLNGFMPEHALKGFEASGLVVGRIGWFAGVVQNTAPVAEVAKDFYGRLEAKVGGMRLDGVDAKAGSTAWRERSLTFGVSGYRGRADVMVPAVGTTPATMHNDTFIRAGLDLHLILDDLMVDAVVVRQRHDAPLEAKSDSRTADMVYGEVTYMTFAWLFPTARFEAYKLRGGPTAEGARWIGSLAINALVRANLTLRAQVAVGADPGDHTGFRFASLNASAAF